MVQLALAKFEDKTRINDIQKKRRDCYIWSGNSCRVEKMVDINKEGGDLGIWP